MKTQRMVYQALLQAKTYADTHDDEAATAVRAALKEVQFHTWQVVLEAWAAAERSQWNSEDEEVWRIAFSLFAGPSNTKWANEDTFAHLASVVGRSNKGVLKMNKQPGQHYSD